MEILDAIRSRRSIRKFSPEVVTDEELGEILDAARLAPSWANTQAWEFVVVRDKEKIREVVESYAEKNPATKGSLAASALVVACAKKGVSGCHGGKNTTKFNEWFMFDLGMAVQNLCLRAWDLGLGTVVVGLMDHDRCKKTLGLPENMEVCCVIPVGRPAAPPKSGPGRKNLSEITHLESYGNPFSG